MFCFFFAHTWHSIVITRESSLSAFFSPRGRHRYETSARIERRKNIPPASSSARDPPLDASERILVSARLAHIALFFFTFVHFVKSARRVIKSAHFQQLFLQKNHSLLKVLSRVKSFETSPKFLHRFLAYWHAFIQLSGWKQSLFPPERSATH